LTNFSRGEEFLELYVVSCYVRDGRVVWRDVVGRWYVRLGNAYLGRNVLGSL
jgi:hypothetical protein